eukprot:5289342-Alexandrium_andersonii.AAC.1
MAFARAVFAGSSALSGEAERTHLNARSGTQLERTSWNAPPARSIAAEHMFSPLGALAGTQPGSAGMERGTRTERASVPR